ncbi:MAG: 16S rRNA (guanine(527)-N(7))-methyltransferase RsmG [Chlorobi bacterium]|nr:16S rRNA (guanine(527)-N(7))-methyltransferase RsmG [Chlorobiota bacterium]
MDIVLKYFPELSADKKEKLAALGELYKEWNSRINVISRKDISELYTKHVLHSLSIAMYTSFSEGTRILDVGTGGGFPGIPLAIFFPEVQFHLIDSIGKKIKVVNAVKDELKLTNVKATQIRVENLNNKFDFIVSRAVTAFPAFVALCKNKILKEQKNSISNGIIYLKGGDFDNEIKPFKKQLSVIPLSSYFDEPFFETKKLIHLSQIGH